MGRPRLHDDATREALLAAAEELVDEGGVTALTIRAVAEATDTSTRAVYSVLGSKQALLQALGARAFDYLTARLADLPVTDDPASDAIAVGSVVYRDFARRHPALFRITFQRIAPQLELSDELLESRARSFGALVRRMELLGEAGGLVGIEPYEAATVFNAMCEGLANAEVRGGSMVTIAGGEQDEVWRVSFERLVAGFAAR